MSHLLDDRVYQQDETIPLINVDEQFAHTRFVVVLEGMIPQRQHKPVVLMRRHRVEVLHSSLREIWRNDTHDGFKDGTRHSVERVVAVCVCGIEVGVRGEASVECRVGTNYDDVFLVTEVGPLILERYRLIRDVENEDGIHVVRIALIGVFLPAEELSS